MTVIAVDFDGTLVEHRYPAIGPDVPGAFEWLAKLQNAGAKLILWTMRDGATLTEAVEHCLSRGITFWGVNGNPEQSWSNSPKAYAHLYIDDAALGCPLRTTRHRWPDGAIALLDRPIVDWGQVGPFALAIVKDEQDAKDAAALAEAEAAGERP